MKHLVHNQLQAMEQLAMTDSYAGSRSRSYNFVESVSDISPEASVVHLVNYQHSTYLHPAREGRLDKMANLLDRLYCQVTRQAIRLVVNTWNQFPDSLKAVNTVLAFKIGYDEWVSGGRLGA